MTHWPLKRSPDQSELRFRPTYRLNPRGRCSSVLDTNPRGVGEGVRRGRGGKIFLPFWG